MYLQKREKEREESERGRERDRGRERLHKTALPKGVKLVCVFSLIGFHTKHLATKAEGNSNVDHMTVSCHEKFLVIQLCAEILFQMRSYELCIIMDCYPGGDLQVLLSVKRRAKTNIEEIVSDRPKAFL